MYIGRVRNGHNQVCPPPRHDEFTGHQSKRGMPGACEKVEQRGTAASKVTERVDSLVSTEPVKRDEAGEGDKE